MMLELRSVTKRYGKTLALDSATFGLAAGEVAALVGANGAGKSTLIKAVVGLVRFEGDVHVAGVDVRRDGRAARSQLGYLPQNATFHSDMTVEETAIFYARLRQERPERARAVLRAQGLEGHEDKFVGQLSGGMRQRLALAVVQFGDPPLLVLDEPATGLDVWARAELNDFVRTQRRLGKAVLMSTHWLDDLPAVADTVILLTDGRIAYYGAATEFAAPPAAGARGTREGHGTLGRQPEQGAGRSPELELVGVEAAL